MADQEDNQLLNDALRLASAGILPMVLKSVIELNIIDTLYAASGDGNRRFFSSSEIISSIPFKNPQAPSFLERMLRLLATHSILDCNLRAKANGETETVYAARPICRFLSKNQEGESLAYLLLLNQDKAFMDSWYHLNDSILEGGVPFDRAHGMGAFEYFGIDQKLNKIFNHAMSNLTTIFMNRILETYQGFGGIKVLVDVGGGTGAALNMITSKYPHVKGINYDLPHVVAGAPTQTGVEHIGGDMFEQVPKGDAIFLKSVLHDWSDDHCLKLLKNCFDALPNGGKVILVELLVPEAPFSKSDNSDIVCAVDVLMIAQHHGGRERTKTEYEDLALKSGFSACELITCCANYWVMELRKNTDA